MPSLTMTSFDSMAALLVPGAITSLANVKMALMGSGFTPNASTQAVWADVSANEIAAGSGYSAGGIAITTIGTTLVNGSLRIDLVDAQLDPTESVVARRVVLYCTETIDGNVKPLMAYGTLNAGGTDVTLTSSLAAVQWDWALAKVQLRLFGAAVTVPQSLGTTDSPTFFGLTLSGIAAGSILIAGVAGLISASSTFKYDSGKVGIGTITTIATELQVASTSTSSPRGIMSSQHNTGTDGARFHMRKSRGTNASPTVVVTGDMLGRLVASGYDGTNYLEMGAIEVASEGTVASTRIPTRVSIFTGTDAAPSVLTEAIRFDSAQLATFFGAIKCITGSVSVASVRGGTAGTGLFFPSSSEIGGAIGGSSYFRFNTTGFQGINTWVMGWGSGAANASGMDTGICRVSAGLVGIGTGAAGSFAGGIKLTNITHVTSGTAGFFGATPVAQPASANQAAITDTAGGTYTAAEQTMLTNIKTLLNQVRADLVTLGLLKGAA